MNAQSNRRNLDSVLIPNGNYVEPGNDGVGKQFSKSLKADLAFFKIHVNADAVITFKDKHGNNVPNMSVLKGLVPYIMSEITSCDQTFFIIHDGDLLSDRKPMTSPNYP